MQKPPVLACTMQCMWDDALLCLHAGAKGGTEGAEGGAEQACAQQAGPHKAGHRQGCQVRSAVCCMTE